MISFDYGKGACSRIEATLRYGKNVESDSSSLLAVR